jgi:hypothetical protein
MRGSPAERKSTPMTNTEATKTNAAAAVAEPGAHVAPEKASSKKAASQKKGAAKAKPVAKNAAKQAKAKAPGKTTPKAKDAAVPREFSKKSIVLDLLRRPKGATMAEIAKATDWQNHSIRGFISGNLTKKMGLTVGSGKNEAGERTYRIAK